MIRATRSRLGAERDQKIRRRQPSRVIGGVTKRDDG
jgi:hypothetical protein